MKDSFNVNVFYCAGFYLFLRMWTSSFLRSLQDSDSFPSASLMTALTSGLDSEQKITGMLKTALKGKRHLGSGTVPGNQEVAMVQDAKQEGRMEFLP